jgi:2,4-dienoyl-CoA reductase (NADPH2)
VVCNIIAVGSKIPAELFRKMMNQNKLVKFNLRRVKAMVGRTLSTAASSKTFPRMMEPLVLHAADGITLKNRVVMGSMHTGLEESGFLFPKKLDDMAEYFAERAKGGVGLMVTGGIAPNNAGRTFYGAAKMSNASEAAVHKIVTDRVHEEGGKIAMQILHTGRYGYHNFVVSASAIKSPIGWFTPSELTAKGVEQTISDYAKAAELARSAGYDGVEIMGSEGYLINQFLIKKTNKRTDQWGGSYENRMRFATEIVRYWHTPTTSFCPPDSHTSLPPGG